MKCLKILFVADIHMSNKLPYSLPVEDGLTDRSLDQADLWNHIYKEAKEEKVEAIFILGDLFDRSLVDAVTLAQTTKVLVASPVPVFILPGNHDANTIKGGRFTVEAFGLMRNKKINVIGTKMENYPFSVGDNVVNFWPIAFQSFKKTMDRIKQIRTSSQFHKQKDDGEFNILLLHNSIIGAEHQGWKCDDGLDARKVCKGFDMVYAGHFHKFQQFEKNGFYVGAPMQFHFGDAGVECGFVVSTFFECGEFEHDFIETNLPKFYVENSLYDKDETNFNSGDYVRYEIEATNSQWTFLKREVEERCEEMKACGINASYKHKSIQQHESRLGKAEIKNSGSITMEEAVKKYVNSSSVVKTGLDTSKLKKLGYEALKNVRTHYGFDRD